MPRSCPRELDARSTVRHRTERPPSVADIELTGAARRQRLVLPMPTGEPHRAEQGPKIHDVGSRWETTRVATVGKEAERAELHKTIWRIANDLRGSVDGWDFKTYVLGTLFYRFISENLTAYLNEQERRASTEFDYAALGDDEAERGRRETVAEKGFYILPSQLFANVRERARHDENLNETLAAVFRGIEGSAVGTPSEDDFKGLFDDLDVNSSKLGPTVARRNEKLVKLLDAIGDLDLGHADNTIDAFGDAYEYLMTMYASNAGKSGGEFFTPQEVSELLARITVVGKTEVNKVYDPACGS